MFAEPHRTNSADISSKQCLEHSGIPVLRLRQLGGAEIWIDFAEEKEIICSKLA
jgi:hypothetical protein